MADINTLEEVVEFVKKHDVEYPDHGIGCSCLDEASRALRNIVRQLPVKTQSNLRRVFARIVHLP